MRRPRFLTVALGVEVKRRLNARVTQDALHGLRLDFHLIDQPGSKASAADCEGQGAGRAQSSPLLLSQPDADDKR